MIDIRNYSDNYDDYVYDEMKNALEPINDFEEYLSETRINFQIIEEKNENEKYTPNYDSLIENALCDSEIEKWMECKNKKTEFSWNMVYCTRQKCGHWEIFQTPQNEHYPLNEILDRAKEYSQKNNCTRCICRF